MADNERDLVPASTAIEAPPASRRREEIPARFKWDTSRIYSGWDAWRADYQQVEALIERYGAMKGTLAGGAAVLLAAYQLDDEVQNRLGRLYRFAMLTRDTDSRNNDAASRVQEAQSLYTRLRSATAWFEPELLTLPRDLVMGWVDETPALAPYRFSVSELYRCQEHVLDEAQEKLLSYLGPFGQTPATTYRELCTSDVKFQTITLSDGSKTTVSYSRYTAILHTARNQEDRARAFRALYDVYLANINSYAAIYSGVLQRDWFLARARRHPSCLAAALDTRAVPESVFNTLISTVSGGTEPMRRYHQLRRRLLKLDRYYLHDGLVPVVEARSEYPYDAMTELVIESVAPLGAEYQALMRERFAGGWVDVYENEGKRAGAYSAGVYGVGPFVLMNYNDTLSGAFTLAHEMGHSMHTVLSHGAQPYATAFYSIFVAEVASTLNEALFLDTLLQRTSDPRERAALLQHQLDAILGTFYTQVLFADFENRAHQLVEQGRPVTAEALCRIYEERWREYYGDAVDYDERYRGTWARIAHFFESPYYVYQYATCFASSAKLYRDLTTGSAEQRAAATDRYLDLLRSGGSDHPMDQLRRAGVDLSDPTTVRSVVDDLDRLVNLFEAEVARI
ncbi:MAG: oligoendopeptidase F [Candidatus Eisenbacteria bacterium]|nr:oligoendopeptidase F [Candidatus Eisenbacteria bacterium]